MSARPNTAGISVDRRTKIKGCILGYLVLCVIPYIHIGIVHMKIWSPGKAPINRTSCNCGCFDTIFKGSYENPGKVGYKHIYFNSTIQTFCIWIATVAAIICLYELLKYLYRIYSKRRLRWSMTSLILLDIYPHYYTWWSIFNYLNDDFYKQFRHQTFFSLTELASTFIIISMCSLDNDLASWKILSVVCISIVHILVGGMDQFFMQLVFGDGATFQRFRNLGFLIPDFLHILIPLCVYQNSHGENGFVFWRNGFTKKELLYYSLYTFIGFVIGKVILS